MFSVVNNIDRSGAELNKDLAKINHWVQQWKLSFSLDPSKIPLSIIFNSEPNKDSHPNLTFNNNKFISLYHKDSSYSISQSFVIWGTSNTRI